MQIQSALDFPDIDQTGLHDSSAGIQAAHDLVVRQGGRYLNFPSGTYLAPALRSVGNVIFVGDGTLASAYRNRIVPTWAQPGQPSQNDVVPARHYQRFLQAVAAATPDRKASYLLVGDSTAEAGSPITHSEQLLAVVRRRIIETFGPAASQISVGSYGVGGTTWSDWDAPELRTGLIRHSWCVDTPLAAVIARNPDAILWSLGQNDAGYFDCSAMRRVLLAVATRCPSRFGLAPDILLITPYAPSLMDQGQGSRDEQEARDYVAGFIRTYALRHGHGLIDQNRVAAMARDGIDVRTQAMVQVAGPDTVSLPYAFPEGASDFGGEILFADGDEDFWSRGSLVIPLSCRDGNALIVDRDPATFRAAVTIDAATGYPSHPRSLTPLHTPGGPMTLEWTVKGAHLRLAINGFEAIDAVVERHGALFVSSIRFRGEPPSAVHLLKALIGRPLPFMPDMLDSEQFGCGSDELLLPGGGNGRNHMSSHGVQRVLGRAMDCARFA